MVWLCLVLALVLGTGAAFSQGLPTGSISGRVESEKQGLPGVSVTAKSPNLQGVRTTVTSVNGDYYFANLPPGQYTIRMELSGFSTHEEQVRVGASQKVTVDVNMSLKAVEATATVVARSEQVSTGAAVAATYTSETMNKLPVARTQLAAVWLAPGVNQNGPNGAVTISGGNSFENVITVNGATTMDNIRGTPFNLFIEDAVQETTTVSSGVSAEFGRFTGGVVNTITKTGGNNFSGSFRATLNNDTWRKISPYGEALTSGTVPTYEATLGGPFWKDHIWFFGAYRRATTSLSGTLAPPVNETFPRSGLEQRYEGKLTITPFQNQTLTGSYMKINNEQKNYYFTPIPVLDTASIYDRQLPQKLWVANYNGVLTENLFLEGQWSQRNFTFQNSGGRDTSLLGGTVLVTPGWATSYHAPIFCAVCPGAEEKRDNEQYFGKLNYFLSTKGLGSHNVVVGYDHYRGSRQTNNYQSGSNYLIVADNEPIYQNGTLFPVFDNTTYLTYDPIFVVGQPSKVTTWSVFLNDTWKLSDKLSFNLGVRYDKNDAVDTTGSVTANDSKWSPRLAAMFDPTGKGTLRFNASYAIYTAAPTESMVSGGSAAGNPTYFYYYYEGPPINTHGPPYLTQDQAMAQLFNWFGITGTGQFPKAGIDPYFAIVQGVNLKVIQGGLKSPNTEEWTAGVGGSVGRRFSYRVEGVYRNYKDFYVTYKDMSTGQVTEPITGLSFDLGYIGNANDPLLRKYYGLHTNFQWRPWDSLSVGGAWTWSHTYGNFIGENPGSGPLRSDVLTYPEYKNIAWYAPEGNLPQDQRHRLRIFGSWDIPIPKAAGHLSLGFLERLDTGLGYGAGVSSTSVVASRFYVTNPGYLQRPSSVTYYYTARDAFRTATMNALDLSLNYGFNIGPVEIFVSPQVINVFNGKAIVDTSTSLLGQGVETNVSRPDDYARFNPFTTIPTQGPRGTGANWNYASNFGQPLGYTAYQTPLTFRVSMGVRF